MRTMAEQPMLPSFSEPVTQKRWAITRFGTTLDGVRMLLIIGEGQDQFFYAVQGQRGAELRSIRKHRIDARYDTEDDAKLAILRAKLAWDGHAEKVKEARRLLRESELAREADWLKALKEPVDA